MPQVDIVWPKDGLDRWAREIERAQSGLGWTLERALKTGAAYVATSAATRTKSAPKKRRNYKNQEDKAGKWPFYRRVWVNPNKGPNNYFRQYVRTATQIDWLYIRHAGLAKKSWRWMLPAIRMNDHENYAMGVKKQLKGSDISIEMYNKLPYIFHALKRQAGEYLLGEALNKGAGQLEKEIDRKLKK